MLKFLLYIYHGRLALIGIYASLTARHLTYIYCIFFLCYTYCFQWQINFSLSLHQKIRWHNKLVAIPKFYFDLNPTL